MAINIEEFDLNLGTEQKKAKIVLAQISAPNPLDIIPDNELDSSGKANKVYIIKEQTELVRIHLERAMFNKPDFILFPELTIPWEMQEELKEFAINKNIYIIGGLFYSPNFENACAIFSPIDGKPIPLQYKLNRAPKEDSRTKEGNLIIVFKNSGYGSFAALICYDFTSLQILHNLRRYNVNIIFLPTSNSAVELFDKIGKSVCYTLYAYVALCNVAEFGNTAGYGPLRMYEKKRLVQECVLGMIAGSANITYPIDFDVPNLNTAIQRYRDGKEVPVGFITPPADLRNPDAILSPYTPLEPARENFVCREEQQKQFRNCIEQKRHLLLLGPSGTGKTSLIYKLRKSVSAGISTGFIEVYDNEKTFDFFRRLAHEISLQVQNSINDSNFSRKLQDILDDIKRTKEDIDKIGYESAFQAFSEYFHLLASSLNAQLKGQQIVIFIDQAERLGWMEELGENQSFAIRLLIRIMKDLQKIDSPIYLVIAVRQHDYDTLIALSNEQLPVAIISIRKFDKKEIERALRDPLPLNISVEDEVIDGISDISGGIPFFVQLLADFAFKNLKGRSIIDLNVFEELGLKNQEDLYPLIMNSVNNNERKVIEAFAIERGYTIDIEIVKTKLIGYQGDIRVTIDQLLSKNIIEELETNRFRFVHDRFKSFIQLEWLVKKQSNLEKMQIEVENIIQLLNISPNDEIVSDFNHPQTVIICFKAILFNNPQTIIRLFDHILRMPFIKFAILFKEIIVVLYKIDNSLLAEELLHKMTKYLVKNNFYNVLADSYAAQIELELIQINKKNTLSAIKYKIQVVEDNLKGKDKDFNAAATRLVEAAKWAKKINDDKQQKELIESAIKYKILEAEDDLKGKDKDFNSAANEFVEAAEWAKIIENDEQQKELIESAIKYKILEAKENLKGKDKDFDSAANEFAKAAEWAKIISDDIQQKELIESAIKYKILEAEDDLKGKDKDFDSAADEFAEAAEWAKIIENDEQQKELIESAIKYKILDAEDDLDEEGKDFGSAANEFVEAAEWAKIIENDEQQKELLERAIKYKILEAEEDLDEEGKDFDTAASKFAKAAEWAKIIGNDDQQKELLERAIKYKILEAEDNLIKEDWHGLIINYTQIALLSKNNEANINTEKYFEKAIEIFDNIKYEYGLFTKLLLSNNLGEAINLISTYYNEKNPEKSEEYKIITSIIESSRILMGEYSYRNRYNYNRRSISRQNFYNNNLFF